MELTKYGEAYMIFESRQTFDINGQLLKTVDGRFVINVSTNSPQNTDDVISLYNGMYNVEADTLNIKIDTKLSKYSELIDVMNTVLDAINQILNEDSEL